MDIQEPVYRDVSFRSLIVDPESLQSRVEINKGWEKKISDFLAQCIADGLPPTIQPPVVFEDPETGELWLADGFHRVGALMKLRPKLRSYKMQVIVGTKRDAMLYSVGANLVEGPLPPTLEDRTKALLMLMADPEWQMASVAKLAGKVGLSSGKVKKILVAHGINRNQIKVAYPYGDRVTPASCPKYVGPKFLAKKARSGREAGRTNYLARVPNPGGGRAKDIYLGPDEGAAKVVFEEILSSYEDAGNPEICVRSNLHFVEFLTAHRIPARSRPPSGSPTGWRPPDFPDIFVGDTCLFIVGRASAVSLAERMGLALSFRMTDPRPAIIICFSNNSCDEQIAICRHHGVEVMTPEEFVASVKPHQEGERSA